MAESIDIQRTRLAQNLATLRHQQHQAHVLLTQILFDPQIPDALLITARREHFALCETLRKLDSDLARAGMPSAILEPGTAP